MKKIFYTLFVLAIGIVGTMYMITGEVPVELKESISFIKDKIPTDITEQESEAPMDTIVSVYSVNAMATGKKRDLSDIRYIVIHRTHNYNDYADALWHAQYMDTVSQQKSWHWSVDDVRCVNHLPDDIVGYHCSNSEGNLHSIGIEICENSRDNHTKAIVRAGYLVKELLVKYPNAEIKYHSDFVNKRCPGFTQQEEAIFKYIVDIDR